MGAPTASTRDAERAGTTRARASLRLDPEHHPVFFYDGECGLCDRTVSFLLEHDRRGRLRFTPLQGETAAATLPPERIRDLDSVVLLDGAGMHLRSSATVRGLAHLGGLWKLFLGLLLIPPPLRNAAYAFLARHRIAWFGRPDACRLVTSEERDRFLP